jgi:hypothetical protein
MLKAAITTILVKQYNNYHVFAHNFSSFDGILLFNVLTELGSIKPIFNKEGKLISAKLSYKVGGKSYTITFNDSLLLLLTSLGSLAKSFNLDKGKTIYPYDFVNKVGLDYVGEVPPFEYFSQHGITKEEYDTYCSQFINKTWSLRDETIKYCANDCAVLFNVVSDFSNIMFNLFRINIHSHPTLPSLAFGVFRSNFLPKLIEEGVDIPQLSAQIQKDIREGYTGGTVDVYGSRTWCKIL